MSPQRRIRPEDLKPETASSLTESSSESELGYPAGGPDPPEVAAMEEPMVPTLSLTAYLALATAMLAVLPRLRSGRFISELMNMGLYVVPVLLAGYGSGVFGAAAVSSAEEPPSGVIALPFDSSTAAVLIVLGIFVGGVLWLWLKSMVDAQVYSLLRGAVSGTDSPSHPGRKKTLGFFAYNLTQLALATGVTLFIGPVILRMMTRSLVTHELGLIVGFVLPMLLGMVVLAWVRILSMFIAAWVTWRPVFIAGALGAAFASPLRDRRIFWGSFILLSPLVAVTGLAVTLCAVGMYLPTIEIDVSPLLLQICLVGTFVTLMQIITWFDIGIVASVGHQVGEYAIARSPEEAQRLRASALQKNLDRPEQQVIHAAPAGLFRSGDPVVVTPIRFEEILRYRPMDGDREQWAIGGQPIEGELQETRSGAQEVSLRFDGQTGSVDTHEDAAPPVPDVASSWVAPDVSSDDRTLRGFALLDSSLQRATLRTSNGLPERRYTGPR